MGINKKYSGYQSFDYLEKEKDYKEFNLVHRENEFEPYLIPLTPEQEKKIKELAKKFIMISLHEHPHLFPANVEKTIDYEKQARVFTAYKALANSYWDAVFYNFMDGTAMVTSKHGWKWTDIIYDLGMRLCDIAHQDFLIRCEKVDDIYRLLKNKNHQAKIPFRKEWTLEAIKSDKIFFLKKVKSFCLSKSLNFFIP